MQICLTIDRNVGVPCGAHPFEHARQMAKRQSHDGGETTAYTFDGLELRVLDGVGAGFVERIACPDISIDFCLAVISHRDIGHTQVPEQFSIAHPEHSQSGINLVLAPAQTRKHFNSFCRIFRFAKNDPAIHHSSICRDDQVLWASIRGRYTGLVFGQPEHIVRRCFIRLLSFVHI